MKTNSSEAHDATKRRISTTEATPNTGNKGTKKDKSISAPTTNAASSSRLIKPKKTKSKVSNPGLAMKRRQISTIEAMQNTSNEETKKVPPFRSSWCPSNFNLTQHCQDTLKISLRRFPPHKFVYGPERERKTCIMLSGDTFSWTEESALVSWIGVSAGETKCVLSIDMQLAKKRKPNPADKRYQSIDVTAQKAVCDMGDTSSELRRKIAERSETGPFAVVCLAPDSVEDHQESISHECQQDSRAIKFLVEKLKNHPALTVEETVQTAVCALKYLFGAKFNSSEIQLWGYGFDGRRRCGPNLKLLPSLVEEYLAANNETTTSGVLAVV